MREDPVELLDGDPHARARWLAARTGPDAAAIWEWGVVERVSTGLLAERIDLQPVGRQMLAAADRLARASYRRTRPQADPRRASGDEVGEHHPRCGQRVWRGDVEDALIHQDDITGLPAELGHTNICAVEDGTVVEV